MNEGGIDIASMRYLNEAAVHKHALACSAKFRAGKFTRVGSEFVDEVKADVENLVRGLRNQNPVVLDEPLEPEETSFVTGALSDKVINEFNRLVGRIIQNKVKRQPTVGKTLSRTR